MTLSEERGISLHFHKEDLSWNAGAASVTCSGGWGTGTTWASSVAAIGTHILQSPPRRMSRERPKPGMEGRETPTLVSPAKNLSLISASWAQQALRNRGNDSIHHPWHGRAAGRCSCIKHSKSCLPLVLCNLQHTLGKCTFCCDICAGERTSTWVHTGAGGVQHVSGKLSVQKAAPFVHSSGGWGPHQQLCNGGSMGKKSREVS